MGFSFLSLIEIIHFFGIRSIFNKKFHQKNKDKKKQVNLSSVHVVSDLGKDK